MGFFKDLTLEAKISLLIFQLNVCHFLQIGLLMQPPPPPFPFRSVYLVSTLKANKRLLKPLFIVIILLFVQKRSIHELMSKKMFFISTILSSFSILQLFFSTITMEPFKSYNYLLNGRDCGLTALPTIFFWQLESKAPMTTDILCWLERNIKEKKDWQTAMWGKSEKEKKIKLWNFNFLNLLGHDL